MYKRGKNIVSQTMTLSISNGLIFDEKLQLKKWREGNQLRHLK